MTTLDELKIRVDDLADMVRVTDSVAVRNDQLLRAQTSLMMAMRKDLRSLNDKQEAIKGILYDQAEALGGMIITLTQLQPAVARLEGRVASMDRRFDRMEERQDKADRRQDKADRRQDKADARLDRMEERQDRMDRNVEAIMRHLGVEPDPA